MDKLSDMRIPFNAAVWIREHKFNTASIAVMKALAALDTANKERDLAEERAEQAEATLRAACAVIEEKQRLEDAVQ